MEMFFKQDNKVFKELQRPILRMRESKHDVSITIIELNNNFNSVIDKLDNTNK